MKSISPCKKKILKANFVSEPMLDMPRLVWRFDKLAKRVCVCGGGGVVVWGTIHLNSCESAGGDSEVTVYVCSYFTSSQTNHYLRKLSS